MQMPKNKPPLPKHRVGVVRDRSQVSSGNWTKDVRREILFPTEASTIGHEKIDRAVERVVSRKK